MTFDEYQKLAESTSGHFRVPWFPHSYGYEPIQRLTTALLGLTGEAGEVADLFKKILGHGHQYDKDKALSEISDVLWYVAELCSTLGFGLEEAAQFNVDKLRRRYPSGFSSEASINRKEEDV